MDIKVTGLCKAFGKKKVLENFSALFPENSVTCIMGPSGCGKTTLLRILTGLEKPTAGSVSGVPKKISAVFQEDRLCEGFSAAANVRLVTGTDIKDSVIASHLEQLGLSAVGNDPVSTFSGGMKRRIAIIRAILYDAPLLILDEPFKGLDEANKANVAAYIGDHVSGRTVIFVTHDPEDAALWNARLLEMQGISK